MELKLAREESSQREIEKTSSASNEPDAPIEWLTRRLRRKASKAVLEIGSGGGFLLQHLARIHGIRRGLVGADIDFLCLRTSRTRTGGRACILGADAKRLPFPDDSFDAVLSNFGFWHMECYQGAIKETYRVLKPGGRLIACEMDHGRLADDLPAKDSVKLAKKFGLYGEVGRFLSDTKHVGFKIIHRRKVKSPCLTWWAIEGQKPLTLNRGLPHARDGRRRRVGR